MQEEEESGGEGVGVGDQRGRRQTAEMVEEEDCLGGTHMHLLQDCMSTNNKTQTTKNNNRYRTCIHSQNKVGEIKGPVASCLCHNYRLYIEKKEVTQISFYWCCLR